MSNFSEEKIERSNDGKFAPKATSETDIDLDGGAVGSDIPDHEPLHLNLGQDIDLGDGVSVLAYDKDHLEITQVKSLGFRDDPQYAAQTKWLVEETLGGEYDEAAKTITWTRSGVHKSWIQTAGAARKEHGFHVHRYQQWVDRGVAGPQMLRAHAAQPNDPVGGLSVGGDGPAVIRPDQHQVEGVGLVKFSPGPYGQTQVECVHEDTNADDVDDDERSFIRVQYGAHVVSGRTTNIHTSNLVPSKATIHEAVEASAGGMSRDRKRGWYERDLAAWRDVRDPSHRLT